MHGRLWIFPLLILSLLPFAYAKNESGEHSSSMNPTQERVVCGPPDYQCSSKSTANPGVVTSIFTSTAPTATTCSGMCQNSTAYDTTINPEGTDCYTRITDGTTTVDGVSVGNFTGSGGDDDLMSSIDETYLGVNTGGAIAVFQLNTSGNCVQVVNSGGIPVIHGITYPFAFDRQHDNVFYAMALDHRTLNQYTITSINTKPSPVKVVDFLGTGVCPGIDLTTVASNSILMPSWDGNRFSLVMSAGAQNTGFWLVSYDKRYGCAAVNFKTGQAWGFCASNCSPSTTPLGTISTAAPNCWGANGTTSGIHDGRQSLDGNTFSLSISGMWTEGVCAGSTLGNQYVAWQIGTLNTFWGNDTNVSPYGGMGGHPSVGFHTELSLLYWAGTRKTLPDISTPWTQFSAPLKVEDMHQAWAHPNADDAFPMWIGATDSVVPTALSGCTTSAVYCPSWPNNLLFGIDVLNNYPPSPPVILFGHTFSCNPAGNAYAHCSDGIADEFGAGNSIGAITSKGNFFCYVSTMLHKLGNDNGSKPRADAFCVHLQ